jgi:hypothetical protein
MGHAGGAMVGGVFPDETTVTRREAGAGSSESHQPRRLPLKNTVNRGAVRDSKSLHDYER